MTKERKNQLLQLIHRAGYIEVETLAKKLFLSPSTVRRNLTELEAQGLVTRSYGKVTPANEGYEKPVKLRFQTNHAQKCIIAAKAAEYLQENTVIFIDGSSTCLHMVPYIEQYKNITVYTNGLELCTMLAESHVPVYCIGGRLIPRSLAYAGEYARDMVQKLRFDAMFFSCSGFDQGVIYDYSEPEAHLRREVVHRSKQCFFLCDSGKIGQSYPYVVCEEKEVTKMITEA